MTTSSIILISALVLLAVIIIIFIIFSAKKRHKSYAGGQYINEQIYVGNLPYQVSEEDLRVYFSQYGPTHSIRVIRNYKTGRSKGYAFVSYNTADQAHAALKAHGKDMQGRSMVVRIAKPRQE